MLTSQDLQVLFTSNLDQSFLIKKENDIILDLIA